MKPAESDIIRLLTRRSGLSLDEGKYQKAAAFVSTRMGRIGAHSLAAYRKYLESSRGAGELTRFMTAFAVGETAFFRNANHWRAFRQQVLPGIIKAKAGAQRGLRFWSAGCSSGEEAYTLAICLWQALERPPPGAIKIVATDINAEALAKGRQGLYSAYSFRGVEMDTLRDHFEKVKGRYRIKERFRQMVEFGELNLVSEDRYPDALGTFDAVFCRNVLMYFRPETAQETIKKIVACLHEEGFLFLGHAEGSLAPRDILAPTACCDTFIYRKRGAAELSQGADSDAPSSSPSPLPGTISQEAQRPYPYPHPQASLRTPHLARILKTPAASGGDEQVQMRCDADADAGSDADAGAAADPYGEAFGHYLHEDFDGALRSLLKAGGEAPERLRELVLMGLIFFNRCDLRRAETYRQKARQLAPTSPEVYALEALIKAVQGDDEGAMKANRNAIFLDGGFFAPKFALAQLHEKRGDAAAAKRCFANARKALDTDAAARVRLFFGLATKRTLAQLCKRK
jgi:chemotaxis protein methyltransferase CheR